MHLIGQISNIVITMFKNYSYYPRGQLQISNERTQIFESVAKALFTLIEHIKTLVDEKQSRTDINPVQNAGKFGHDKGFVL